ncbi:hypothetical protein [Vulcanisaeta sp. JCM 16159]|uniref:hypothetical protein n=1 Tax=Vulcanisaeta sp. JCM 16159 TaxID=1295371 RepID=UPI0006D1387D|nr:hypothetical protein [Vulcanisaeta sp. JCM 16159]
MRGGIVLDPMEWLLIRNYYMAMLPQLNFKDDYLAAELAPSFCNYDGDLREFQWDVVNIVMPPAEVRPGDDGLLIVVEGYSVRLLRDWGLSPDIAITDFDFVPEELIDCDCLVLGHAHGDNITYYPKYASRVRKLLPTVQVWPRGCSLLIPGFTDGDRAVYLAYYMGAREIRIYGFNPGRVVKRDDNVKRIKLDIAKTLINRVIRKSASMNIVVKFY